MFLATEDITFSSIAVVWDEPHDGGRDIDIYIMQFAFNPRFEAFRTIEIPDREGFKEGFTLKDSRSASAWKHQLSI